MTNMIDELNNIELDQYGLNRILINLILQMFIKNNIDDPNDIIYTIADYMSVQVETPVIGIIAGQLNIMNVEGRWIWCL